MYNFQTGYNMRVIRGPSVSALHIIVLAARASFADESIIYFGRWISLSRKYREPVLIPGKSSDGGHAYYYILQHTYTHTPVPSASLHTPFIFTPPTRVYIIIIIVAPRYNNVYLSGLLLLLSLYYTRCTQKWTWRRSNDEKFSTRMYTHRAHSYHTRPVGCCCAGWVHSVGGMRMERGA